MKKESKDKLEEILEQDLNNYENMGFNDEGKAKALAIIRTEAVILRDEDKALAEIERDNARLEIEKEKLRVEESRNEKQYINNIEERSANQSLEETKMEAAEKREKKQMIISIITAACPLVLGIVSKCIYAGLAINAQKHDYEDFKLESSSSKEQRNNLLK